MEEFKILERFKGLENDVTYINLVQVLKNMDALLHNAEYVEHYKMIDVYMKHSLMLIKKLENIRRDKKQ